MYSWCVLTWRSGENIFEGVYFRPSVLPLSESILDNCPFDFFSYLVTYSDLSFVSHLISLEENAQTFVATAPFSILSNEMMSHWQLWHLDQCSLYMVQKAMVRCESPLLNQNRYHCEKLCNIQNITQVSKANDNRTQATIRWLQVAPRLKLTNHFVNFKILKYFFAFVSLINSLSKEN